MRGVCRRAHAEKARAGLIEAFTGVSDPFEPPGDADVVVGAGEMTLAEAASLTAADLSPYFRMSATFTATPGR